MSGTSISYPHSTSTCISSNSVLQKQSASRQSRIDRRSSSVTMATCYSSYELSQPNRPLNAGGVQVQQQKDYSRPLHVDCSVEYELPNQAKPPAGVRNEPLLMIHPCYFRKIESQRRSPFVNNLPTRPQPPPPQQQQQQPQPPPQLQQPHLHSTPLTVTPTTAKRRPIRGQQIPQQMPQQAAQYPVQYTNDNRHLWDPMAPLVSITTAAAAAAAAAASQQTYCKRATESAALNAYNNNICDWGESVDRSPDRPEDKHILTGKYRQYLRAHRLHPYVASAIPLASTFPQIQQVCYNV